MVSHGAPRLLLLDCDGVLIRSEAANLAYYNDLFREFDLPRVPRDDEERFRLLHTLSTPQVIDVFFPEGLREAARAYAEEIGFARYLPLVEAEPGWGNVLDRWRARGWPVAVATNRGVSAAAVLEAVGLLARVDHLVTIKDVARPKPHPDLLLFAMRVANVGAAESIYVGDSELDREAAARAGVAFVGFGLDGDETVVSVPQVGALLERVASCGSSVTLQAIPA